MSDVSSMYLSAAGIKTHLYAAGEGDGLPIVFVHGGGLGSDGHSWLGTLAYVGQMRRAYAPDTLGFGRTDAPEMAYDTQRIIDHLGNVLDALRIDRAILVGHSLGATIVARFAVQHPERVAGVAMVAPGGGALGLTYQSAGHVAMNAVLADPTPANMRALTALMRANDDHVTTDAFARLENAKRPGHLAALRAYAAAPSAPTLEATLPALSVPLLLVWGNSERFNPPDLGAKIAAKLPNLMRYVAFDDAGHYVHYDQPRKFAEALTEFFDDVEVTQ